MPVYIFTRLAAVLIAQASFAAASSAATNLYSFISAIAS
jgi:hypothetical protein